MRSQINRYSARHKHQSPFHPSIQKITHQKPPSNLPTPSELPLPQPPPHPLLPHRPQPPHTLTRLRRLRRLQHVFRGGPLLPALLHPAIKFEQFDARVLRYVAGAEGRGGAEGGEPGWEGDGGDVGFAVGGGVREVVGDGGDEGGPGARGGVDDVVVVEDWGGG